MTVSPLSLVETLCEQAEEKLQGDDADSAEALVRIEGLTEHEHPAPRKGWFTLV